MTPFQGLRILDLSRLLAGPYCTQMLGDLGAEVIKVEPPEGDDSRALGPPFFEGDGVFFLCANGGKKSIAIDLRTPEGVELVHRLARESDVFVENFRPGVATSLGVGYDIISELNPAIVYCSISGFGEHGPLAQRLGVDTIFQSMGGLVSLVGDCSESPMKVGSPVADLAAANSAAFAIAAALYERARTGKGTRICVSIRDALVALLAPAASYALLTGREPPSIGNASHYAAPADIFATADGHLAISTINNRHWQRLCEALSAPALAADPRYRTPANRLQHRTELGAALGDILRIQTSAHWTQRLEGTGVPFGPIMNLREIVDGARGGDGGLVVPMGELEAIGLPFAYDDRPLAQRAKTPALDEHAGEIRASLDGERFAKKVTA